MPLSKPNLVVPLAMSYDTRNVDARTQMQAGKDQRKVNCFYDDIVNAVTGKATHELVKRPGPANFTTTGYGTGTTPLAYDITRVSASTAWVVGKNAADNNYVADGTTKTTILNSSTYKPYCISSTDISGVTYGVAQLTNGVTTDPHRVFYASAIGSWTEITDTTFTSMDHVGKMEFMDGYAFILDGATGRIHNSDLNSLSAWGDTSYITKSILSDRMSGLCHFGSHIIAFGTNTAEVFVNAGNPSGSPLQRVKDLAADVGLIDSRQNRYYAIVNRTLYFVGREAGNSESVGLFSYNGQTFSKISSPVLNRILGAGTQPLFAVCKVGFSGKTAIALKLTDADQATQKWMMYFPDIGEWFEWTSDVFSPVNIDGLHIGSASFGAAGYRFYPLTNRWTDDGTAFTMTVQFKVPKTGNNREFMNWCGVEADTTSSAINLAVSFADDGLDTTFSAARNIDLNTEEKCLTRCGSYKNARTVRMTNADNVEVRLRRFIGHVT